MEKITSEVLANIGVWGLDGEPLTISVNGKVTEIIIALSSPRKEFLNLKSIEVMAEDGEDLMHSQMVKSAVISSNSYGDIFGESCVLARIRKKHQLHSKYELNPYIKITFKKATYVETLVIRNRADICGLRSRTLDVTVFKGWRKKQHFSLLSADKTERLTGELNRLLEHTPHPIRLPKKIDFAQKYIRSLVYALINKGYEPSEQLQLALLPVDQAAPVLDNFTALYLTKFIEDKFSRARNASFATRDLEQFGNLLGSDIALETLADFASDYLSAKSNTPKKIVIAKHRVHLDNLNLNAKAILDFLDGLFEFLHSTDGTPMLAYGTLLGAVRDNGFLQADDDLDLILHYDQFTTSKLPELKQRVCEQLKQHGFSVTLQEGCPHLTVNAPTKEISVDVFFSFGNTESNDVDVVMENLIYKPMSRDTLLPTQQLPFYDRQYPCPADCQGFLEQRYGEGWKRSDPYHEWPWKLKRAAIYQNELYANQYEYRQKRKPFRYQSNKPSLVAWSQCVNPSDRPPSNSVPMFQQALDENFDVIEVDVLTTADDKVVLAHDDVMTNDKGESISIAKATLEETSTFSIGTYQGQEVFIPSLQEVLPLAGDKRLLIDARFKAKDYESLRTCVLESNYDPKNLVFCVYKEEQLGPLMAAFPDSIYLWKLYTQAWEIDDVTLRQVALYGVDGVMFLYPHYDEDISESLYNIRRLGLQSLCFIHGQQWTPPSSTGLSPTGQERSQDIANASLQKMVSYGIEYVTTSAIETDTFKQLTAK